MLIPNYTLKSEFDSEEEKRLKRESECPHAYWTTKCSSCGKYLASDHHINYHTNTVLKDKYKIAVCYLNKDSICLLDMQRLRELDNEYDQIIVLVDSFEQWQLFKDIKFIWRVSEIMWREELDRQIEYRETTIDYLDFILYPDTKFKLAQKEEIENFCKKHKLTIKHK